MNKDFEDEQPLGPQPGELLADGGLPCAQKRLKLGDRAFAPRQVAQDHQPPLMPQRLEKQRRLGCTRRHFIGGQRRASLKGMVLISAVHQRLRSSGLS